MFLSIAANAQVVIGTNTLLPPPTSAAYSAVLNFRPGDGAVANVNPPRFSWSYTPEPTNALLDITHKTFDFQVSTQANFATLDVNISGTEMNFYNALAPFANTTNYWRVKYYTNGVLEATSATRSFTIPSGLATWDRSMFADTNYLATNAAVHPFIMVTPGNRLSISNNLNTNALARWDVFEFYATNLTGLAGWPTQIPEYLGTPVTINAWAQGIGHLALYWQLTRKSNVLDSLPGVALSALATNYLSNLALVQGDVVSTGSGQQRALALGYDWLHELMTTAQRSNVLRALDARCDWIANGAGIFGTAGWTNPGTIGTGGPSHNKAGFSHDIETFNTAMVCALAGYQDGLAFGFTNMARLLNFGVNYMLGVTYCYGFEGGMNQGRGYAQTVQFTASSFAYPHMVFEQTFHGMNFARGNPWWQTNALWWDWMHPVGFVQGHEPWGDGGFGRTTQFAANNTYRDLAWITQRKMSYDHWVNETNLYAAGDQRIYDYERLPLFYFYSAPPTAAYTTNTAALFQEDGWAIAASAGGPQDRYAFTNGLGLFFGARPRGSEIGHSGQTDLSYQLWAYGASITDSGAEGLVPRERAAHAQYTMLFNGYGAAQPYLRPIIGGDYYARFVAWANNSDFTYVAADGTKGYPQYAFTVAGNQLPTGYVNTHGTGPLRGLTKAQREIFLHKTNGYFIVRASFTSTTNFIMSDLFPILHDSATINTNTKVFSFVSTNTLDGHSVTSYVYQGVSTGLLNMVKWSGANVTTNMFIDDWFGDSDAHPQAHMLWTNTKTPATNGQSIFYIFPLKPGVHAPPTDFERLDDETAKFTFNGSTHTNTFGTNYTGAVTYRFAAFDGVQSSSGSPTGQRIFGINARVGTLGMPRP